MAQTFFEWMASAKAGAIYHYASGNLAKMRIEVADKLKADEPLTAREIVETDDAHDAWQAALRGDVDLVQRRNAGGGLEYLAIRRAVSMPLSEFFQAKDLGR